MSSTLISEPKILHKCVHCSLDFYYNSSTCPSPDYCCYGCKTVYELLTQSGLQKFYDIKSEGGGTCFRPPLPALSGTAYFKHWDSSARSVQLYVGGVHCTACLWLLEKIPQVLAEDVISARLDIGKSLLFIELTPDGEVSTVASLIRAWGYRPELITETRDIQVLQKKENQRQVLELGIAGALAGNIMLMSIGVYAGASGGIATLFDWVAGGLSIPVVFYSGRSLFVNVRRSIQQKYFSIDTPILLAILVAFFWSWVNLFNGRHEVYFDSLTSLVFLILASRYVLSTLRRYDLGLTSSVEKEGVETPVVVGETLILKINQNLSFDAILRKGACFINQAFLTGESAPVLINEGESIYAGSIVMGFAESIQASQVEVAAVGAETRLAKIIEQLKQNKGQSSRVEKLYDKLAKALMLMVFLVGSVLFAWHGFHGQWQEAISRTMALFIVTCPCALAFATPLNISFALRESFWRGLIIKNPDAFELSQKIKKIFFDKTGTLTNSNLKVKSLAVPLSEIKNLRALVSRSKHPVSCAIMSDIGLGEASLASNWRENLGVGVSASIAGRAYSLQKSNAGLDIAEPAVNFYCDEKNLGQIVFSNPLRAEAFQLVGDLHKSGYEVHILSGDRNIVVQSVAKLLNLNSKNAKGDLFPEDKAKCIDSSNSLFVGDGINDVLALKAATLGIAMHGGLQVALENSSIYMIRPDLNLVREYLQLAKKVRRIHLINFIYSSLYNAVSGGLAIFGLMNPLVAAIVMPLSATSVFAYTYYSYRASKLMRGKT